MKNNFNLKLCAAFILLVTLCLRPAEGWAQTSSLFTINGNNSPLAQSDSCIRLTNGGLNVFGSMWYKKKADLTKDFDISATMYFGTGGANGADGMTFAFQNQCVSAGNTGADLGIGGVTPSFIIQFDTYVDNATSGVNYGDPNYDFIAMHKNGDVNFLHPANTLFPAVPIDTPYVRADLGQNWNVRIKWTAADTTIRVWFGGSLRATYSGNIVRTIFSNNPYVYWGFTAGSGGLGNVQSVCMDTLPTNAISIANFSLCEGQSKQVSLPGYSSYAWSPRQYVSDTTISNPVLSPPLGTTNYTVRVTDACNNVEVFNVTATVNPTPNVSLTLPFSTKCLNAPAIALSGGSPLGGVYSGGGVSGGVLTPSIAGLGVDNIKYKYTNNFGCSDSAFYPVTINSLPNVSLSSLAPVCISASPFALSGGSPAGSTYSGPGVSSGTFNPATAGAGAHTITYSYTDVNGCSGSATQTITVNQLPAATIGTPNGTVICSGSSINLTTTAASGVSYQWSLGGSPVTTLATGNTSYTATAAGTYTLYASSTNGCSATSSAVTVTTGTAISATISSTATQFCPGSAVTLSTSTSGGQTVQWYLNNSPITNATSTTYSATAAGAYKAVITAAGGGCTATSNIITLTQLPGVAATASASLPAFCPGTASITLTANTATGASYQWLNNNAPISGATSATYTASTAGSYSVVESLSGCTDTSSVVTLATASSPVATLTTPDSTFCPGTGSLSVNATSGATYAWYLNGNTTTGNSNTLSVSQSGSYYVVVTNSSQCQATSNAINMSVQQAPSAVITSTGTAVCSGAAVVLTASPVSGASYEWFRNNSSLSAASSTNTYSATTAGSYTCVVSNGCSATSNAITITVSSAPSSPTTLLSGTNNPCPGGYDLYVVGAVAGATSYTWSVSPAGGAFVQNGQGTDSVVITYLNQDVTISVTANNACGSSAPTNLAVTMNTAAFCNGTSVAFGANPSNTCTGSTVTFYNYSDQNALTGLNPVWDFGAGASPATSTSSGPVTVTYSSPGYKNIFLAYNDGFGNYVTGYGVNGYVNVSGSISTSAISGLTMLPTCSGSVQSYSVTNTPGSTYSWTVTGGSVVSGQGTNNVSVNFTGNGGTVSVTETNSAGCVGTPVQLTVGCPLGINDLTTIAATLEVYPNPTNGLLSLACQLPVATNYDLKLYSVEGAEVLKQSGKATAGEFKHQLELSDLPKGVYFLRMQMEQETISRKIVLQ
jgi:hypothetical protein